MEKGVLTSNGEPVAFFHYSGFDPSKPEALTRYPSRAVEDENLGGLRTLMKEYAQALQAAKASLPQVAADLPCSRKNLFGRLSDYRRVYGAFPEFTARALLGQLAHRLAMRWQRPRN